MAQAYVVAALRTAGARKGGRLSGWHPADLAADIIDALVDRTGADPSCIDDVVLGCVSQVGEQSSNVARNAVLASRLPQSVPGTSVDRQCGSSQQALHFAAQAVMSGSMDVVIAGGVESMTRVPMFSASLLAHDKGLGTFVSQRIAERFGVQAFSQFSGAEQLARKYGLGRDELDSFALRSHRLAAAAEREGRFRDEILPLPVRISGVAPDGTMHERDEGIRASATLEGIGAVKTLQDGGLITAANASQICDGASGALVVNERGLKVLGVEPMARIHHMKVLGHDPVIMLEAPIPATQSALATAGMTIGDIDLFEVNEAFAPVPLAWLKVTGADPGRVNVNGGGIALGHPLGASGTKLAATLLHELRRTGKRFGLQTMCEHGGLANVTIFENLSTSRGAG